MSDDRAIVDDQPVPDPALGRDPAPADRVPIASAADGRPVLLPRSLVLASAWAWRLAVIGLTVYALFWQVLARVQTVTTSLLVAILVAGVLHPLYRRLVLARIPRLLSAAVSVVLLLGVIAGAFYLVGQSVTSGMADTVDQAGEGLDQLLDQAGERFGLDPSQVDGFVTEVRDQAESAAGALASGALGVANTTLDILTGLLLTIFATLFFLADGPRIWSFLVRLMPHEARAPVDVAGRRAWLSVGAYVRTLPIVALADAIGIGGGAALLGVPFAIPIAVLTFFSAFVPLIGAIVAGTVAVLVALVSDGVVVALVMLAVIIAVQQAESHLLQPLLLGRALDLHPLVVVLSTTSGLLLAGVAGGVLAVPLVAATIVVVRSLARRESAAAAQQDGQTAGPHTPGT